MTIILTRGLPASGKSSWAKSWVAADPSNRVRVNRDDIRYQLYGKYWGVEEDVVSKVEEAMVKAAVDAGKDVVIDATHLAARYITRWRKIYGDVDIRDFGADIQTLCDRDIHRQEAGERGVGVQVIRDMAKRYGIKSEGALPDLPAMPEPAQQWIPAPRYQEGLEPAIIVDIDGTLADHTGVRSPYDTSKYHLDKAHLNVAEIVGTLNLVGGYKLILVSGRDSAYREVTEKWLYKNALADFDALYMRPEGDTRNDAIVKHELYHEHIAGKFNVIGVFDDRGRVLRMWRAIGLTTFAVGDTDNYNF